MKHTICSVKSCRNYGKYCRLHLSASVKEPTAIEKESEKRKIINREYAKKARQFVKDNPACQASIEGICTCKSQCVHHKKGKNSKEDLLVFFGHIHPTRFFSIKTFKKANHINHNLWQKVEDTGQYQLMKKKGSSISMVLFET